MITAPLTALSNARAHAWASRLYSSDDLLPALSAETEAELQRALARLGVPPGSSPDFVQSLIQRIVPLYEALLQSRPRSGEVLNALLQLHDIENLKLVWRSIGRGIPAETWLLHWRPLGRLARLPRELCRAAVSLPDLCEKLRGDSFGAVADTALRIYASDPLGAEQSFTRFGLGELLRAALRLARREEATRLMILALLRELDLHAFLRSVSVLNRSPAAAAASTVLLAGECSDTELARLAEWNAELGPIGSILPRVLHRYSRTTTWEELFGAMHQERIRFCIRALRGHPYRAAPAVAVALLFEEQARAITALATWRADPDLREAVRMIVAMPLRS